MLDCTNEYLGIRDTNDSYYELKSNTAFNYNSSITSPLPNNIGNGGSVNFYSWNVNLNTLAKNQPLEEQNLYYINK